MTRKNLPVAIAIALALLVAGYFFAVNPLFTGTADAGSTAQTIVLTGTYTCLPHTDTSGPQTMECAFGIRDDNGIYYAVNFGASGDAMSQFQSGSRVTAEGFLVARAALSTDQWAKYNMEGLFTVTEVIHSPAPAQGKINIDLVCQNALAYMTFADAASAEAFIGECKEGKHPEVIERYLEQLNLGDGAAI